MYFWKFKLIVTQKNAFSRIHEERVNFLGVQERVLTFNKFKLSKIKLFLGYLFQSICCFLKLDVTNAKNSSNLSYPRATKWVRNVKGTEPAISLLLVMDIPLKNKRANFQLSKGIFFLWIFCFDHTQQICLECRCASLVNMGKVLKHEFIFEIHCY